jgi:hypothetical protein
LPCSPNRPVTCAEVGQVIDQLCHAPAASSNVPPVRTASRAELDRLLAGCRNDVDRLALLRNQRPDSACSSSGSPGSSRASSRGKNADTDRPWSSGSNTGRAGEKGFSSPKSRLRAAVGREEAHSSHSHQSRVQAKEKSSGLSSVYESRMKKYYSDMAKLQADEEDDQRDSSAAAITPYNRKS